MVEEGHRYPPPQEGDPETNSYPKEGWTCFHCGENFKVLGAAQDHFGADPDSIPGCLLKVQFGDERGMVMAMRKLEDGMQTVLNLLNDENWDITAKHPEEAAIIKAWEQDTRTPSDPPTLASRVNEVKVDFSLEELVEIRGSIGSLIDIIDEELDDPKNKHDLKFNRSKHLTQQLCRYTILEKIGKTIKAIQSK